MKMQNRLFHKNNDINDDDNNELDQYISENCTICKEELIRVEDIFIGKCDDMIYCADCKDYHRIDVVECIDIII